MSPAFEPEASDPPDDVRLTGETTARMGSRCNIQALRDVYPTSGGKYVALSTGPQGMAERLLRAIGRADPGRRSALFAPMPTGWPIVRSSRRS
jgi:crotonobetainyl-CoA:carnitine CoA-transferase CaiB-like acyl-CoA transferase